MVKIQLKFLEVINNYHTKFTFDQVQKISSTGMEIKNDEMRQKLTEIGAKYVPYFHDKYESKWGFFFLPVKQKDKVILVPLHLKLNYHNEYYLLFDGFTKISSRALCVSEGNDEVPEVFQSILEEVFRFEPLIEEFGLELIEYMYPWEWRTGLIQRKFVKNPEKLISVDSGIILLEKYNDHLKKNLTIEDISLDDYLNTAAIGYKAAFDITQDEYLRHREPETISNLDLYKRWADSRHGGMLYIKESSNKMVYMEWLNSRDWEGAHPFEIVYSGNLHGIYLYPPMWEEKCYRLSASDYFYYPHLLKMLSAFIDNEVPFIINNPEYYINFCTGEAKIKINDTNYTNDSYKYEDTDENRKTVFNHIEWDELMIAKKI